MLYNNIMYDTTDVGMRSCVVVFLSEMGVRTRSPGGINGGRTDGCSQETCRMVVT